MSQETNIYIRREIYICDRKCMWMCQKRPKYMDKRDIYVCHKRPVYMSKETYICVKQVLTCVRKCMWMCQKRPIYINVSTETYIYVKRDMYMSQTRPLKKLIYKCIQRIFFLTHVLTAVIRDTLQKKTHISSKEPYAFAV